jgi:hypothetical protein
VIDRMIVKLLATREPAKEIAVQAQQELRHLSPVKSATR